MNNKIHTIEINNHKGQSRFLDVSYYIDDGVVYISKIYLRVGEFKKEVSNRIKSEDKELIESQILEIQEEDESFYEKVDNARKI